MIKSQRLGKKFQEEYKILMYSAAIFGLYPPGFENLVKNVYIKRAVYFLAASMVAIAATYISLFFILALFTNVYFSRGIFFLYFRRVVACSTLASKIVFNITPAGYRKITKVFETWNTTINYDFYVEKRQKLLAQKIRGTRWLFIFTIFFSCGLLQVPTLILFGGRNAYGAKYAVFPHDPEVWYHWYLVSFQFVDFFFANLGALYFNIFCYIIMLMANTQLTVLQESLRDIFHENSKTENDGKHLDQFIKSEKNIKQVRKSLQKWITVHQETLSWFDEVQDLFKFTSTVKFVFLGLYICLAVFTVPGYIRSGRATELIFVLAYTLGNYVLLFFESRLADKLFETSSQLFMGAYDTNWCGYPRDILKSLQIIHQNSIMRPFRIKSLGVFYDSSATFLSIMQSAYQALSLLLQVEI